LLAKIGQDAPLAPNPVNPTDGTMNEILQKSSEHAGDANLEEVFFRATGEAEENA